VATLERLTGGAPAQAPLVLMAYQSRSRQTDAALFARLARRFTVAEDAEGARRSALVSDKVRLYQLRRRAAAGV